MDIRYLQTSKKRKKTKNFLSKRQEEVLCLLTQGYSIKQISTKLNIAIPTVKVYKYKVSAKIGSPNLALLTKFYLEYKEQNTTPQNSINIQQKLPIKEIETSQKIFIEGLSYQQHLDNYRYKLLLEAFIACNYSVPLMSEKLGLAERTLYRLVKQLGLRQTVT